MAETEVSRSAAKRLIFRSSSRGKLKVIFRFCSTLNSVARFFVQYLERLQWKTWPDSHQWCWTMSIYWDAMRSRSGFSSAGPAPSPSESDRTAEPAKTRVTLTRFSVPLIPNTLHWHSPQRATHLPDLRKSRFYIMADFVGRLLGERVLEFRLSVVLIAFL